MIYHFTYLTRTSQSVAFISPLMAFMLLLSGIFSYACCKLHSTLSFWPAPSLVFSPALSTVFSEFCRQSFYLLFLFGHFLSLISEFLIQSTEYFRCFSMFRVWPYSFPSRLLFWVKFTLVVRCRISLFRFYY